MNASSKSLTRTAHIHLQSVLCNLNFPNLFCFPFYLFWATCAMSANAVTMCTVVPSVDTVNDLASKISLIQLPVCALTIIQLPLGIWDYSLRKATEKPKNIVLMFNLSMFVLCFAVMDTAIHPKSHVLIKATWCRTIALLFPLIFSRCEAGKCGLFRALLVFILFACMRVRARVCVFVRICLCVLAKMLLRQPLRVTFPAYWPRSNVQILDSWGGFLHSGLRSTQCSLFGI